MAGRRAATFEGLLVLPHTKILGNPSGAGSAVEGGPVWPDFAARTWERHGRAGEVADQLPDPLPPVEAELLGEWAWCGPIVLNFSHQFAEFMHRLPLGRSASLDGLLFTSSPLRDGSRYRDLPPWVASALSALGLGHLPVTVVDTPTRVERLTVLEAGTEFCSPSHDWYLDELLRTRPWPADQPAASWALLSRAGQVRGIVLGETYLEGVVRATGGAVVRPEDMSVEELLGLVEGVRHLVVTDGGVAHPLELLGRLPDRVTMLARRGDGSARHIAAEPMEQRAGSFALLDANDGYASLDFPDDPDWDPHGVALPDIRRLLSGLRDLGLPLSPSMVDLARFADAARADLERHLTSWFGRSRAGLPDFAEREATMRARVEDWLSQTTGR